jgi:hypothetical protein
MKRVMIALIAVLVLVGVGGGAFAAGTKVGENRAIQDPARFFQQRARDQGGQFPGQSPGLLQTPQPGQRGAQGLGGGITGTIEEVKGNTLVVSTGTETIRVQTTDTTLIQKYMPVTVGDLKVGEQVVVSGSRNDDGSYTARSIQSMRALPSVPSGQ